MIERFDRVERWVHWINAVLFGLLLLTGAILYFSPLMALIGRRDLVQSVHVYTGLALPVPVMTAIAGRWGKGLRTDLARWNRWSSDDRRWLRGALAGRTYRAEWWAGMRTGKFNAGQKLNASFIGGLILVMLGTGIIMEWYHPYPLAWRTGATWVHDWLALAALVVIAGHVCFALADREALRSMLGGTISRSWAARHAPAWLEEVDQAALAGGEPAPAGGAAAPEAPARPDG